MAVLRIMIMITGIIVIPLVLGYGFMPSEEKEARGLLAWNLGLLLLWAMFLVICLPLTLLGKGFSEVMVGYGSLTGGALMISLFRIWRGREHSKKNTRIKEVSEVSGLSYLFWGIAAALLIIQLVLVIYLAYEEGDDAYYVAIVTSSRFSDKLYTIYPYTGFTTGLTVRYAMAPFPVWIALLARISGLSGAATAHVVMPLLIIPMAYGIYYLIGKKLLKDISGEKSWYLPFYMILVELLVIFGGYSTYSRENFLLVRAGQGKAVLANIIIPILLYLLMLVFEKLEAGKSTGVLIWFWLAVVLAAGCLCSTLGSFLLCILLGLGVFCGAIAYRRWRLLIGLLPCMILPAAIVALYLKLQG